MNYFHILENLTRVFSLEPGQTIVLSKVPDTHSKG